MKGVPKMKIPYGVQMQICRRRMYASPTEIAEEFNLSTGAVFNVLRRNADVVDELEAFLRQKTVTDEDVGEADLSAFMEENNGTAK